MKTIFKIAKTELALLFYSPIAWFLLIAFVFQTGYAYTNSIDSSMMFQDMGGPQLGNLFDLTFKTFSSPFGGIWRGLVGTLYLYLPLLTMGLMSREISGGTIRLLNSSPVNVREIIFGKYLAMMIYNLVLVSVLVLIVTLALFNIHAVDAGSLVSAVLGIYLVLCTYAAIGLFMSCLTSYQVVAALSTLVLLAILNYIGQLWQDVDFVKDLAYFLSITGRVDKMLDGLTTSKDVLYFMIIIFMFLGFSITKLRSDQETRPFWVRAGRYVLLFAGAMVAGYISSLPRFTGYWDSTASRKNTLTENSRKILEEMGDTTLEVTSYINLLEGHFIYGMPGQRQQDKERWESYVRFKPTIKLNYIYYYDSTGNLFKNNPGQTLKSLVDKEIKAFKLDPGLIKTPEEIRQIIDLRPEKNRYVMQLKYKDKTTFLRIYNDNLAFPTETETAAALKRLLKAGMPRIVFAQGEGERGIEKAGDRHYKRLTNDITFRYSLVNQGFDVSTLSLKTEDIPSDITALVIADPKIGFDSVSMRKLFRYIAAGGNLLIAGEPGNQAILDPLMRPLGVGLMEGMLVQRTRDFSPELIQAQLTPFAAGFTKELQRDAHDSLCVTMRGAASFSYTTDGPFTVMPLLMTPGQDSWNKKIRPDEKRIEEAEDAETPVNTGTFLPAGNPQPKTPDTVWNGLDYSPVQGDRKGPLPVMIGLTRTIHGRQQRIVLSGDADFLSNLELGQRAFNSCNFDFSTAVFSWFSYGEFPIDTSRPIPQDNRLDLTDGGLRALKIFLLWVLPGLLLVCGGILLLRRKRK